MVNNIPASIELIHVGASPELEILDARTDAAAPWDRVWVESKLHGWIRAVNFVDGLWEVLVGFDHADGCWEIEAIPDCLVLAIELS